MSNTCFRKCIPGSGASAYKETDLNGMFIFNIFFKNLI